MGKFREDLYYRLNVYPIEAPPLRERREDIPAMAQRFVARFAAEEGRTVRGASPETLAMLQGFDWPGNVRQLENSVFRAVILCEGEWLAPEDFPQIAGPRPRTFTPANDGPATTDQAVAAVFAAAAVEPAAPPVAMFDEKGHVRPLEVIERDLIVFAISHYAGHMSEVARRLGIGRSTLYRKLREYGIDESALKAG